MQGILNIARGYFSDFKPLFRLPREFWGIQAVNLVYCLMYFSFVTIASVYLSQDAGFSDETTGVLLGMFMFGTAILQIILGPVLDRFGYRKMPILATGVMTVGVVGIGLATSLFGVTAMAQKVVIIFMVVAMIGNGMFFPVLTAATKRFSNKTTMGAAFSMWYLTMNIGGVLLFTLGPHASSHREQPHGSSGGSVS